MGRGTTAPGTENADKCATDYGTVKTFTLPSGATAASNMVGNDGVKFMVQSNWDPQTGKCSLSAATASVAPNPLLPPSPQPPPFPPSPPAPFPPPSPPPSPPLPPNQACPATCQFNNGSNISEQNSYTVNAQGVATGTANVIGTYTSVDQCISACTTLAATYPIVVRYMYYIGGEHQFLHTPQCVSHGCTLGTSTQLPLQHQAVLLTALVPARATMRCMGGKDVSRTSSAASGGCTQCLRSHSCYGLSTCWPPHVSALSSRERVPRLASNLLPRLQLFCWVMYSIHTSVRWSVPAGSGDGRCLCLNGCDSGYLSAKGSAKTPLLVACCPPAGRPPLPAPLPCRLRARLPLAPLLLPSPLPSPKSPSVSPSPLASPEIPSPPSPSFLPSFTCHCCPVPSPRPQAPPPQAVACPTTCQFNNGSNISEQNSYTVNAQGATGGTDVIGTFTVVEDCISACLTLSATYPIVVRYMYYIGGQSRSTLHPNRNIQCLDPRP